MDRHDGPGGGIPHVTVFRELVTRFLTERGGQLSGPRWYLDGTLGAGGHTEALLHADTGACVLGFDRDESALDIAQQRLKTFGERLRLVHANFRNAPEYLHQNELPKLAGAVLDLGVSSMQFDKGERGFSFRFDAPLDMRMDPSHGPTAADILSSLTEAELVRVLSDYGEVRFARTLARAVVSARKEAPIKTTGQLRELCWEVAPKALKNRSIHPATQVFQALRIATNGELEGLQATIEAIGRCLTKGGRLAVISFHSLEDRAAKQAFRELSKKVADTNNMKRSSFEVLTPKPIQPDQEEQAANPRSRSARLRVIER